MKQRTHTWLAIRAIGLLQQTGEPKELGNLLRRHVRSAAVGAWIPDLEDTKRGHGDIDNHILKMKPYAGGQRGRFTVSKSDLLKKLGSDRAMHALIKKDAVLDAAWWNQAYKADPKPGQHLGNCAMGITKTLKDLLILGDPEVAKHVPGRVAFAHQLHPDARSREEEVATYCFILSHFVADACMPCHCDGRPLSRYSYGLHKELEAHWNTLVGTYFDKAKLLKSNASSRTVLKKAELVGNTLGLSLPAKIPRLRPKHDMWLETIFVCRASFALAQIIAPVRTYPFGSTKRALYATVFGGTAGKKLLAEIDRAVLQDAVLDIAIAWKSLWNTFR